MTPRTCRKCERSELETPFYETTNLQRARVCRECHRRANAAYDRAHTARRTAYLKKWRKSNPQKVRAQWQRAEEKKSAEAVDRALTTGKSLRVFKAFRSAPYPGWTREEWARIARVFRSARRRAAIRGVPFDLLNPEDVIVSHRCACCSCVMNFGSTSGYVPDKVSLDCVRPSLGYVKGNVALVCMRCNRLKNNASVQDLVNMLAYTAAYEFGARNTVGRVFAPTGFDLGSFYATPQYQFALSATAVQHFTPYATTATIQYDQSTTGAGAAFSILGQAAKSGSGANGGVLNLQPGAGDGAGVAGTVNIGTASPGGPITIGYNGGVNAGVLALGGNPIVIQAYQGGGAIEVYALNMQFDWGGGLGGFVAWDLNNLAFHYLATTPLLWQYTPIADVATVPMTIRAQYAYASATGTHRTAGNLVFDIGAPTNSGTTEAAFQFTRNASAIAQVAVATGSQIALWLGTATATTTNPSLISDGSSFTYLNCPSNTALGLVNGDATFLLYITPATAQAFWGGTTTAAPFYFDWSSATAPKLVGGTASTSLTVGTNKTSATLILQADAASTVATLSKVSSTSSSVVFSSPGLATAATINVNDNGAVYVGAGALSTNYILFNGTSQNYVVSSGGNHIFADNAAHTFATLTVGGGIVLKGNSTTPYVQGDTTSTQLTVGTNKSGASTIMQGDAATTILTLTTVAECATQFKLDNVTTPSAFASGATTYANGGRYGVVDSDGTIILI